jgi:hypothetical protein
MKRVVVAGLLGLAAVISSGTTGCGTAVGAVPPTQAAGTADGRAVPSFKGSLLAVSADSPADAWAAGSIIAHWNGSRWSAVTRPGPGANGGFTAVRAFSKDDVWVAGSSENRAFILHWNGKSWSRVKTPALAGVWYLNGLAGASPSSLWAAGETDSAPAILHWNGRAWSKVSAPLPHGIGNGYLNAVTVRSPADAWAVGGYAAASGTTHPLVLHWNGRQWSPVASPNSGSGTRLNTVTAYSADSAWAAGYGDDGSDAVLLHWNGKSWSKVPVKNPGNVIIWSVAAASATSVWAAGAEFGAGSVAKPLIMRWNGETWSRLATGSTPQHTSLAAMTALSGNNAWAVGTHTDGPPIPGGANAGAVILHWNGKAWS